MPVMMAKKRLFVSLFGTAINDEFNYNKYFSMLPTGPDPKPTFTKGYFRVALAQNPKPQTVAIAAADAEFGRNASDGARENAKKAGLRIVYDKTYPPNTTDFAPIIRAHSGDQSRSRPHLLLSARFGGHGEVDQRDRLQAENARRRHGRPAGERVQDATRAVAQRHRQLRDLDPGLDAAIPGVDGSAQEVSGARRRRRRRSARLLHAGVGLRLSAGSRSGDRGDQEHQGRRARRLHAQDHVQDRGRRCEV